MRAECCNNCNKGKRDIVNTVEFINCYEIAFRFGIIEDTKLTTLPSRYIKILDIDNFKCDFYKAKN